MGMYTEIYVNVNLKKSTPDEVLYTLKAMCGMSVNSERLKDRPQRWEWLFYDGSFYTPNTCVRNLTYNDVSEQWSLLGKGDIKNYGGEIEEFFEWLSPWVDGYPGDFIGYSRYEDARVPTLIFLPDSHKVEG